MTAVNTASSRSSTMPRSSLVTLPLWAGRSVSCPRAGTSSLGSPNGRPSLAESTTANCRRPLTSGTVHREPPPTGPRHPGGSHRSNAPKGGRCGSAARVTASGNEESSRPVDRQGRLVLASKDDIDSAGVPIRVVDRYPHLPPRAPDVSDEAALPQGVTYDEPAVCQVKQPLRHGDEGRVPLRACAVVTKEPHPDQGGLGLHPHHDVGVSGYRRRVAKFQIVRNPIRGTQSHTRIGELLVNAGNQHGSPFQPSGEWPANGRCHRRGS